MYSTDKISSKQALQQCNNGAELFPCFHFSSCESVTAMTCVQMEDENKGSNMVVSEANGADLHCQDVFQGSSKVLFNGASENTSNHWQW